MKEAKKFLSMFLAAAITVTSIGFATPQNVNAASGKQYAVEEQEAVVTASDGDLLCLAQAVSASDGLAKVVSPGEGEEKSSVYGDTWTSVNTALQSAKLVQAKGTDVTKQEVKNVLMGLESALKGLKVVTADNGQLAVEVTADDGDEALLDAAVSAANAKKQADYTVESWEAFKTALDAAKVLEAKKTTKRNVVCAIVALSHASVSLVAEEGGEPFVSPDQADIDELEKAVKAAEAKEETDYTEESWTPFAAALKTAQDMLTELDKAGNKVSKADVQKATKDLTDAMNALVEVGEAFVSPDQADIDELEKAVKAAEAKEETDYTEESWTPFAAALKTAQDMLTELDKAGNKVSKADVQKATKDLTDAMNALVEVGEAFVSPDQADIDELEKAVKAAEAKEETDYTEESWTPFAAALKTAQDMLTELDKAGNKVSKADVQKATKDLTDAMNALVEKEPEPLVRPSQADIEALNNAVAEADKKVEADYTVKSWEAFAKALKAAKDVQEALKEENNEVTKDQVVDATEELINKTEALENKPGVNKTALKAAIKAAEEKHQMDYTAETWYPFLAALVTARNVDADDNALQSKVDAATERLVAKTNALVLKPTEKVDKTELKAAIDAAEAKKEADYTAETWAPFAAALKAAKDTYANETAKQSDIETAIDDLAAATKALKEKEVVEPPVVTADKGKLKAAITAADKLKKADYTSSTWTKFEKALKAAKTVNNNSEATQSEVDKATTDLENAKKALKKVVKVKSIKISSEYGTSLKIAAGKSVTLKATASPSNATNKAVTWSIATKDKKYATVNKSGKVTTKKAGAGKTVTVTATAKDGSKKKKTIKVKIMKNAVTKITVKAPKSVKKNTVKANQKVSLTATVKTNGSKANKTLTWKSSNTKYATVDKKGKVSIKKAGKGKTVTITATATDGTKKKGTIKLKIKK